jgi:hypothetical protein
MASGRKRRRSMSKHPTRASWSRLLLKLALLLLVSMLAASTGCSRTFYRRQADVDAYALVREKAIHPHWRLPSYTISVDPRSRMYDPYSIDCPPIPPDDPTSHELMHCVDNKRGWPFWHDNGDRPFVENPAWPEYIEIDERGVLRVGRDDAVRLALLHSRGYQQQLETLYLSALDVSFERFRFDTQFFAGASVFGTWDGRARTGLARRTGQGGNSSSVLEVDSFARARKLFPTGADLVVNFANSLVWQFSGPDDYAGNTLIDFALVQPLLRDAGRDRVLERLTRAERILLSNVRAMETYRQSFVVSTLTGGNPSGGPSRAGGQLGGAGLENFAGVGAGGFGNIGGGQGAQAGGGDAAGAGAQQAGNYMGLLQDQRQIRNAEDNVRRLRRNLTRLNTVLREQPPQVTTDFLNLELQVAQARQALLNAESTLLNNRNAYQANLDNFKVNILSLPPQICLEPSDNVLDQFELIQQDIIRLPEDWEALLGQHVEARQTIAERIQSRVEVVPAVIPPQCRLPRYPEIDEDLAKLRPALAEMQQFVGHIVEVHFQTIERDIEAFRQAVPRRKARIERLFARIEELRRSPCELLPLGVNPLEDVEGTSAELTGRLDTALADVESSFQHLSQRFRGYRDSLGTRGQIVEELLARRDQTPEQLFQLLVRGVYNPNYQCGDTRVLTFDVVEDITRELIELQLLQARARTESIEVEEVDIRADQALEVARRYRRDWMNARAALVDSWRLIQFNADQLQSTLDIVFSGDVSNVTDNPFRLRSSTGRLRAGVQFDAPITRLAERNLYRQSTIEYQQARRNYYNFEDGIARGLRATLRTIANNEINFELQRLAVVSAARQVMLNTFIDQESQVGQTTRLTAARDVVQALSDLLNAQNNFMSIWINYEVLRLGLDFNLGTMQLDSEGLWIDPGKIGEDYGSFDPWLRQSMNGHGGLFGEEVEGVPGKPFDHDPIDDLPPPFMLPPAGDNGVPPLPPIDGPPLPGRDR